ncbi:hypothetical protein DFH06DRAFT_436345 [Mycena polygramma]|nr:hypothetical protein DFH06DRAFT_436345 [Mycena polygramma]
MATLSPLRTSRRSRLILCGSPLDCLYDRLIARWHVGSLLGLFIKSTHWRSSATASLAEQRYCPVASIPLFPSFSARLIISHQKYTRTFVILIAIAYTLHNPIPLHIICIYPFSFHVATTAPSWRTAFPPLGGFPRIWLAANLLLVMGLMTLYPATRIVVVLVDDVSCVDSILTQNARLFLSASPVGINSRRSLALGPDGIG